MFTQCKPNNPVGQKAGCNKSCPQSNVELLCYFWLDPHEQAENKKEAKFYYQCYRYWSSLVLKGKKISHQITYFLNFSSMSAILPKRFCIRSKRIKTKSCIVLGFFVHIMKTNSFLTLLVSNSQK